VKLDATWSGLAQKELQDKSPQDLICETAEVPVRTSRRAVLGAGGVFDDDVQRHTHMLIIVETRRLLE
jgi:hypothetical protein